MQSVLVVTRDRFVCEGVIRLKAMNIQTAELTEREKGCLHFLGCQPTPGVTVAVECRRDFLNVRNRFISPVSHLEYVDSSGQPRDFTGRTDASVWCLGNREQRGGRCVKRWMQRWWSMANLGLARTSSCSWALTVTAGLPRVQAQAHTTTTTTTTTPKTWCFWLKGLCY